MTYCGPLVNSLLLVTCPALSFAGLTVLTPRNLVTTSTYSFLAWASLSSAIITALTVRRAFAAPTWGLAVPIKVQNRCQPGSTNCSKSDNVRASVNFSCVAGGTGHGFSPAVNRKNTVMGRKYSRSRLVRVPPMVCHNMMLLTFINQRHRNVDRKAGHNFSLSPTVPHPPARVHPPK